MLILLSLRAIQESGNFAIRRLLWPRAIPAEEELADAKDFRRS